MMVSGIQAYDANNRRNLAVQCSGSYRRLGFPDIYDHVHALGHCPFCNRWYGFIWDNNLKEWRFQPHCIYPSEEDWEHTHIREQKQLTATERYTFSSGFYS